MYDFLNAIKKICQPERMLKKIVVIPIYIARAMAQAPIYIALLSEAPPSSLLPPQDKSRGHFIKFIDVLQAYE